MRRIPEKFFDAALGFSLELARDSENFPKKVLSLFDKYFTFRRSIFFPCGSALSPEIGRAHV